MKTLGDHLRKRRLDLGLLQRDVAGKLQVSRMTVCNWETGRTSPLLRFIPSFVAFLGYSPYHPQSDSLGKRILA
ncbi:MAG TPA: helix-turn-helix transcriptional regulator, partial [Anaerolineae bacterium]|nr:helix-turn-helix transcriptional regulator [Anaerolineae bacterium]